ncbi:MAG: hypothetical protein OXO56_00370, partial [Gammaproteobacteria bacterium]|nr:hypothetical protein [Gammaproteobacteria bacterium]
NLGTWTVLFYIPPAESGFTGADMTRAQFVREIEQGNYPNYHVREIDGVKTPVSNPDGSSRNNLG